MKEISLADADVADVYWDTLPTAIASSVLSTYGGITLTDSFCVLTKVWTDCGKCFTAERDADTNVWIDCGKCFTALFDADTNVWIEPLALPPSPTFIVNVPSCLFIPLDVADTNVCAPTYDEEPMLISNVSLVTFDISNHLPDG